MNTESTLFLTAMLAMTGCAADGPADRVGDPIDLGGVETEAPDDDGSGEVPPILKRTSFDLTFPADRALFTEQDIAYQETVGAYAVYRIIGPDPQLVGPAISYTRQEKGWAMLCGASRYFAPPDSDAEPVTMQLRSGVFDDVLAESDQGASEFGDCAKAADDYGDKFFDEPPESDEPVDDVEVLVVGFGSAPTQGSTVLIRRVALYYESPGHNDSHVIPPVCCTSESCGLGDPPPDEPDAPVVY